MKRMLTILTMLAACVPLSSIAQEEPSTSTESPAQNTEPCLKVEKVQTNADAVAQGGRISVILRLQANDCDVAYRQRVTGYGIEGLAFNEKSPFRVTSGSSSYGAKQHAIRDDTTSAVFLTTHKLGYSLVVEALPDAPIGDQNLVATLSYQTVDSEGKLTPRQQTLSIPIKVVPAGTQVQPQNQRSAREKRETIILIALAPVLLPLMLISSIVYYIQHGQWPSS